MVQKTDNSRLDPIDFKTLALIGSAFEHGILEQLMGSDNPGVSTMKLFQIANSNTTNNKVFYADSSNFSTGSNIKSQLINYDAPTLATFDSLFASTNPCKDYNTLIVPENGRLRLNEWEGKGYISKRMNCPDPNYSDSMEMAIGRVNLGGFNSWNNVNVAPKPISNISDVNNTNTYTPVKSIKQVQIATKTSTDPVDMAGGAYLYDNADIALGGASPLGLTFSRSYNSSENLEKRTLGYGWTHNYDIYITPTSHAEPVLGRRQPVDAVSMIAGLYVMLDLTKNQDNIVGWMTASLSHGNGVKS